MSDAQQDEATRRQEEIGRFAAEQMKDFEDEQTRQKVFYFGRKAIWPGIEAMERGDRDKAASVLEPEVTKRNPVAEFYLGKIWFSNGQKARKDQGKLLLLRSAGKGFVPAQIFVGQQYLSLGTTAFREKAFFWFLISKKCSKYLVSFFNQGTSDYQPDLDAAASQTANLEKILGIDAQVASKKKVESWRPDPL